MPSIDQERGTSETFLNDVWTMYFHDPSDSNWTIESYLRIGDISTVQDFLAMFEGLKPLWGRGMFFLMREHIQPLWEDKNNRDGGCISFKVFPNEVDRIWFDCCASILGERLARDQTSWGRVCGISIAPKRGYCLIRIWVQDTKSLVGENALRIPVNHFTKTIFKVHKNTEVGS